MNRAHVLVTACAITLPALAGAQQAVDRHEFRELHMGVEVRMVIHAEAAVARSAARAAFDRIATLEQMMSDYRASSEVRRLQERAGGPVPVSAELFQVLHTAVEVARRTSGAFDPTVGPLVLVWRDARRQRRLPAPGTLEAARALVSWRDLALDSGAFLVTLRRAGMQLDVGGVAKGYILDRALDVLRSWGASRALIEAGGDVVMGDAPPGRAGWQVDVPYGDTTVSRQASALVNAAIATSGPSAQFLEVNGVRYSHVIDPRTGWAVTSGAHATVIASDAALADALATALTVMKPADRERVMAGYDDIVLAWSVR